MKRDNVKRIPVSISFSVIMIISGIVMTIMLALISKDNSQTFNDMIKDPWSIIFMILVLFCYCCAVQYYKITDEEIIIVFFVFHEHIKFKDICEIGVAKGNSYDKNTVNEITYIMCEAGERKIYHFLLEPSDKLYSYLSENYELPFVDDKIDDNRRVELRSSEMYGQPGKYNGVIYTGLSLFLMGVSIFILSVGIYVIYLSLCGRENIYTGLMGIVLIAGSHFLIVYTYGHYMNMFAKFRFDSEGVHITYPNKNESFIKWGNFQQICICFDPMSKPSVSYGKFVICFVTDGVKRNKLGKWHIRYVYNYKKLPYMYYSDEMYEEIRKYYPREIVKIKY